MRRPGEDGAGVLGTVLGAGVFLAFLLFAVQVLVGLYTGSVLNAVTYDAAKAVAGSDGGPAAQADAEANAVAQLGDYGADVDFTWDPEGVDPAVVRLRARGPRLTFLPAALTGPVGLDDIVRTVTVRREQVQ